MWKFSRRRDERAKSWLETRPRPAWGHPARHEDDWPAQRNRMLVDLLALTSNR